MSPATQEIVTEFIALVEKMRSAQRQFFTQRDREALIESKQLEKQVDRMLQDFKKWL
jgi:hypothetical protein